MARISTKTKIDLWHSRQNNTIVGLLAIAASYLIASRAIDTGSLMQYFLTLVLLVIAVNRLIHAIRNK